MIILCLYCSVVQSGYLDSSLTKVEDSSFQHSPTTRGKESKNSDSSGGFYHQFGRGEIAGVAVSPQMLGAFRQLFAIIFRT